MPNFKLSSAAPRARLIVLGLAVALTASGCAQLKGRQGYVVDPLLTTAITPGVDNRESVEKTLGRPTFVGQFSDNEYYYVSRETRQLAFAKPRPVHRRHRYCRKYLRRSYARGPASASCRLRG